MVTGPPEKRKSEPQKSGALFLVLGTCNGHQHHQPAEQPVRLCLTLRFPDVLKLGTFALAANLPTSWGTVLGEKNSGLVFRWEFYTRESAPRHGAATPRMSADTFPENPSNAGNVTFFGSLAVRPTSPHLILNTITKQPMFPRAPGQIKLTLGADAQGGLAGRPCQLPPEFLDRGLHFILVPGEFPKSQDLHVG